MIAKLTDLDRLWLIFKALLSTMASFGAWPVSLSVALAMYCFSVGLRRRKPMNRVAVMLMGLIGSMLAGYFLIYAMTPHDLDWHLGTSADRLLLQLWPSALFVYFSLVRTPEEMMSGGR